MPETFAIIGRDAPDSRAKRPSLRAAHLAYWREHENFGRVVLAGPMTDFAGSLFVVHADSLAQVGEWMKQDPYVTGGVFEAVEIHPFRCVLPIGTYGEPK